MEFIMAAPIPRDERPDPLPPEQGPNVKASPLPAVSAEAWHIACATSPVRRMRLPGGRQQAPRRDRLEAYGIHDATDGMPALIYWAGGSDNIRGTGRTYGAARRYLTAWARKTFRLGRDAEYDFCPIRAPLYDGATLRTGEPIEPAVAYRPHELRMPDSAPVRAFE